MKSLCHSGRRCVTHAASVLAASSYGEPGRTAPADLNELSLGMHYCILLLLPVAIGLESGASAVWNPRLPASNARSR